MDALRLILWSLVAIGCVVLALLGALAMLAGTVGMKTCRVRLAARLLGPDGRPLAGHAVHVRWGIASCSWGYTEQRQTDDDGNFGVEFDQTFPGTAFSWRRVRGPTPAVGLTIEGYNDAEVAVVQPGGGDATVYYCDSLRQFRLPASASPLSITASADPEPSGWLLRVAITAQNPG